MAQPVKRRPISPIRWWWVVLAAAMTALATWGATWWLLAVAGHSADLRVQAIKAGLTVAAGTGGAVALMLAARRQWLQERDQSHREETDAANHAHQQRLAELSELDATERRITDLYTKAVDQLGSPKAPVRLGGLYALERLAQDNPNQRQTIVNVICAYLRMPYELSPDSREELQVRLTAQRVLASHLNRLVDYQTESDEASEITADGEPLPSKALKFWDDISIDLTGATLIRLDFSGCTLSSMACSESVFVDGANFRNATFADTADFSEAIFGSEGNATFKGAEFGGDANFSRANFHAKGENAAIFRDAVFSAEANFAHANFEGDAVFYNAQFKSDADFGLATFTAAYFDKSNFEDSAAFEGAEFVRPVSFINVTFNGIASFSNATFTQANVMPAADLRGVRFSMEPDFYAATVSYIQSSGSEAVHEFWPRGWVLEPDANGIGRLVYSRD